MGLGVGIGTLRRKEGCVASTSDLTENSELILAMLLGPMRVSYGHAYSQVPRKAHMSTRIEADVY